jgi:hypothetical protein
MKWKALGITAHRAAASENRHPRVNLSNLPWGRRAGLEASGKLRLGRGTRNANTEPESTMPCRTAIIGPCLAATESAARSAERPSTGEPPDVIGTTQASVREQDELGIDILDEGGRPLPGAGFFC